jgi:type II secretory pathway pseudopilin PulG
MGKKRAIILVALIAVIGGGAASYFMGGKGDATAESVRTSNTSAARAATSTDSLVAEITATIYQIDRLQLDPSIFNSAAFRVLRDRTQVIPPEVPGRENPFAPLYSDRATATPRVTRPGSTGGLLNLNQTVTASGTAPILPR